MNLHIVPDNTFINTFYDNLEELNLLKENKIIVRTNNKSLSGIKRDIPFAPLYSSRFNHFVGDTVQYKKVFIHYFTPLLYRWVAQHNFQELNWMIWGGDLYNLPSIDKICYEPLTLKKYHTKNWSIKKVLYDVKVWTLHAPYKKIAYSKIKNILTWMEREYQFALKHLPIHAKHKFFFYENPFPYEALDALRQEMTRREKNLLLIIGNSGSPTNNHIDIVQFLEEHKVKADLFIPVSYGDARYISFLKKNLTYRYGTVEFVDRYMQFEEYLRFLTNADALVMNTIRPQGYGNILMMMYMDKPVFINKKNISVPDLDKVELKWLPIEALKSFEDQQPNKQAVMGLLSHERLLEVYQELFS